MFKPLKVVPLVGRQEKTPDMLPSTSSEQESKNSIARQAAARAVHKLFRFCEIPDTGDPEGFLAAAIGIAAKFPVEACAVAFDPINGLPSRMHRPKLCDIRAALENAYESIERRLERERITSEQRARLPARLANAEDKSKVLASWERYKTAPRPDDLAAINVDSRRDEKIEQQHRQAKEFLARCKREAEASARPAVEFDPNTLGA